MKRTAAATGIAAIVVASLATALFVSGRRASDSRQPPNGGRQDSLWYHASDVALLAKTGRPQLVEFFHPG